MSRYPRAARDAKIKCVQCNAPVTETVDGGYACVDCGRNPLSNRSSPDSEASLDETTAAETSVGETTANGSAVDGRDGDDDSPFDDGTGPDDDSPFDDETGIEDAPLEDDHGTRLGVGH